MSKHALIFTHLQCEGLAIMGDVLFDRGFDIERWNTPRRGVDYVDALSPDLLIVMGGPVGTYQRNDFPFLQGEIDLVKERIAAGKSTLGICLGAQIIASALGCDSFRGDQGKELGWFPVTVNEEGMKTPARHLDGAKTNMFHWHGDTFELPKGAKLLASSEQYKNQIFSYGDHVMAVQCHPEVQSDQLEEWYVMLHSQITGDNPLVHIDDLRIATRKYIEVLNVQGRRFFLEWLEQQGL